MSTKTKFRPFLVLCSAAGVMLVGCVQTRYQYGVRESISYERPLDDDVTGDDPDNPIVYGGDYPRLDRLEDRLYAPVKYFKSRLPGKMKRSEVDSPDEMRERAIALSQEYLQDNGLNDIQIDVRRYEPREQWERLKANDRISPLFKYTGGTLSIAIYSLLPGRVLHNDGYNPYTNTLSLNSTKQIDALYEAAQAKEYHRYKQMGLYSMAQFVPFVPVFHTIKVASDMNTYASTHELWELEKQLYPYTYSKIAGTAVSETLALFPIGTGTTRTVSSFAVGFIGTNAAEIAGKEVARRKERNRKGIEQPKPTSASSREPESFREQATFREIDDDENAEPQDD